MAYCDNIYVCKPQPQPKACTKQVDASVNVALIGVGDQSDTNKLDHLVSRLYALQWEKYGVLDRAFYHIDQPKTAEEAIERIKAGKFTLDQKAIDRAKDEIEENDGESYYGPWYGFSWETEKKDKKAYQAVRKLISDDYQKALDDIKVLPPVEGLAALREFEAKEYTLS